MASRNIERIRERIRRRLYDMTAHAMEEMAEDLLDIVDVETAILNGSIVRTKKDDPRGTRFVISGIACDGFTPVEVVGRFVGNRFLIITVYEIT